MEDRKLRRIKQRKEKKKERKRNVHYTHRNSPEYASSRNLYLVTWGINIYVYGDKH
jgi:hypothetical protein